MWLKKLFLLVIFLGLSGEDSVVQKLGIEVDEDVDGDGIVGEGEGGEGGEGGGRQGWPRRWRWSGCFPSRIRRSRPDSVETSEKIFKEIFDCQMCFFVLF